MFYSSVVCSVLTFGLSCWGGNLNKFDRGRVDRITRRAGRVVGKELDSFDTLYRKRISDKLTDITDDSTHPLRPDIDSLRIVRSGRFRIPKARTYRYLNSFVPAAVRSYNAQIGRRCISLAD